MVYDWEGKRDACYRMYIEEKKSLDDIMEYMKTSHQFAPSKRAFQTQFKRWGFPSKHNPAHKSPNLVARVKELWENNVTQRDMLRILNDEGYMIGERGLMRLRAKNRWLLRVPNGMKSYRESVPPTGAEEAAPSDIGTTQGGSVDAPGEQAGPAVHQAVPSSSDADIMVKRQERLAQLRAESDERWATKKRRRRTRGWGGLPADPPGPPRFPSETTLDERPADPQHAAKVKAVEVLCRDVMKRLRDDQAKRDPSLRQATRRGPNTSRAPRARTSTAVPSGVTSLASQALASTRMASGELGGIQIDPSLIQAATNDPSFAIHQQPAAQPFDFSSPILNSQALVPVPVFLRIHPQSQIHQNAKTWISKLNTRTVAELRMLALVKFKDARVARIEGTVRDDDGSDISFLITEDHELDAYLTHVQGRTATFSFVLQPAQQ
ncbi:hypothetical protein CISG_09808 [Coccidioides immitis RMSCC 3703]|uniref:Uncharacterized protein n=1 Tax=Coccidioides immitis RMSCC 3703 TaxID=454286 RepID=A0A0J8QN45_COCIT|nr:hypothetical protein CISG_09808 [Coccidioides immitis RMSCC 3703]